MAWGARITGIADVAPELRAAVREGTQHGLEKLGAKGQEIVHENITTPYNGQPPAVCFGNLAESIVSDFQPAPGILREVIGVGPALQADQYAAPVETGARPHMPPVSALLPWVQKKFGIEDEKHALSVAFAVARRISVRGTGGHFMFTRALETLEPLAAPTLEHEIGLALARHGFTGVR